MYFCYLQLFTISVENCHPIVLPSNILLNGKHKGMALTSSFSHRLFCPLYKLSPGHWTFSLIFHFYSPLVQLLWPQSDKSDAQSITNRHHR